MSIYSLLEFCKTNGVQILAIFPLISLVIGLFLSVKPSLAIELQRKFYERINWKMEPVSMQTAIRDTKFMGLVLVVLALPAIIFTLIRII